MANSLDSSDSQIAWVRITPVLILGRHVTLSKCLIFLISYMGVMTIIICLLHRAVLYISWVKHSKCLKQSLECSKYYICILMKI